MKHREIRADFDDTTITVYQAYNKAIALPAITNGRFESPFSFNRMTWIKPSFLWMMERSNWAEKSNQEFILGIKLKREHWEKALSLGVLTHPDHNVYEPGEWEDLFANAKIHIQWDPERTLRGAKLEARSIQVGVSRHLITEFNDEWIEEIVDMTPLTKKLRTLMKNGKHKEAKRLLPKEKVFPISSETEKVLGTL